MDDIFKFGDLTEEQFYCLLKAGAVEVTDIQVTPGDPEKIAFFLDVGYKFTQPFEYVKLEFTATNTDIKFSDVKKDDDAI